ncbi:MAG: tetratricopeptide (TPR) repeat protein [Candidatus Omnitrophota bacterium]
MKNAYCILLLLILTLTSTSYAQNSREEFNSSLDKFSNVDFGSEDHNILIKETIEAYLQLDPKPALPTKAEEYLFQGEAAVEMARDKDGFLKAIDRYKKALQLAPWAATAYYNLSIVYEKSELYHKAAINFERYLWAAPDLSETEDIKKRIVKLKYKEELASQQKSEDDRENRERHQKEASDRLLAVIPGIWKERCTYHDVGSGPVSVEFSVERNIIRHRRYLNSENEVGWTGWEGATKYDPDKNGFDWMSWDDNREYIWVRSGMLMEKIDIHTNYKSCTYKR